MLRVTVNGSEVSPDDEGAITQQVNRRDDGVVICVQVRIEEGGLNMVLSTPQCSGSLGGGRPPNQMESRIFELWGKLGLATQNFAGRQVVAFLKQLRKLLP